MNVKLMVENFPNDHSENMIRKILSLFGEVKKLDLIKDTTTGMFKGSIQVEFSKEEEAKEAYAKLMGMRIGDNILQAKKLTTLTADVNDIENRIFKNLIEDKPTHCLMLRNVLKLNEIESREDYVELEKSV